MVDYTKFKTMLNIYSNVTDLESYNSIFNFLGRVFKNSLLNFLFFKIRFSTDIGRKYFHSDILVFLCKEKNYSKNLFLMNLNFKIK